MNFQESFVLISDLDFTVEMSSQFGFTFLYIQQNVVTHSTPITKFISDTIKNLKRQGTNFSSHEVKL